jgi:hypothetical protein
MRTEDDILNTLKKLIGNDAKSVAKRPNHIGSINGDTVNFFAFDIKFIKRKDFILGNCDYWLPIINKNLPISETYWRDSDDVTIWINKKKYRKLKFEKINEKIFKNI